MSVNQLVELSSARGSTYDHIVIESSGISEPKSVRSVFQDAESYDMKLMEQASDEMPEPMCLLFQKLGRLARHMCCYGGGFLATGTLFFTFCNRRGWPVVLARRLFSRTHERSNDGLHERLRLT